MRHHQLANSPSLILSKVAQIGSQVCLALAGSKTVRVSFAQKKALISEMTSDAEKQSQ